MRNSRLIPVYFLIAIFFTNCVSVVEVFDEYQSEKYASLANQKVLVIYKTTDKIAKERFEIDMAERLRKAGVDAEESHIAFPDLKAEERTPEELETLVKLISDKGFNGIVVTKIKSKNEKSETSTVGGYDQEVTTGEGMGVSIYNYSYHYYGFGSFYGSSYNSNLGSMYVEEQSQTTSYNVYAMETVTYNISFEKEEQLVGVLTATITDPTSYEEVADKYTKLIRKQFKKAK